MGLEEILEDAGGFGRMQLVVLLVIYLGKLFSGWSVFQVRFKKITIADQIIIFQTAIDTPCYPPLMSMQ